jgi:hypothetical protein
MSAAADVLIEQLGIVSVPITKARDRGPLETCAPNIIAKVIADHGTEHATVVLRTICESSPSNALQLMRPVILAVSDVLAAHLRWADSGLALLEAFDAIDLGSLWQIAKRAKVQPREAIATLICVELEKLLGPSVLPKPKKVKQPKPEPKRISTNDTNIRLGIDLLELRAEVSDYVRFSRAMRQRFDVDQKLASHAMSVARLYSKRPEIFTKLSWNALVCLAATGLTDAVRANLEQRVIAGERIGAPEIRRARGAPQRSSRPKRATRPFACTPGVAA